jgi:DNA polymerase-3 subunit beta
MTATVAPPTVTTVNISRTALRVALGKLLAGVDTTSKALPVAQHVLIEAADNALTMTATNFEVFVRLKVSCECEGAGSALLPAKLLSDIVAALPPAPLTIALETPNATITAGRSRFEVPGLPPVEFPKLEEIAGAPALELVAAPFLDALTRCVAHTTDAQSRPAFNGVLVELEGQAKDRVIVVGCEGSSFARLAGGAVSAGAGLSGQCLIHRTSVPILSRLFGDMESDEPFRISLDGHRLQIASADVLAHVRLIDYDFPSYRQLLTAKGAHVVVCDRLLLAAAVKRVAIASSAQTGRIEITLDGTELTIRAPKGDRGAATDVVPLEAHDGSSARESIRFGVNAALLGKALQTLTADRLAITIDGTESPVFLRGESQTTDDPTLALVMPLRIID